MKKAIFIFSTIIVGFILFTGQNVDDGPRWSRALTHVYPTGQYVQLSQGQDNFISFSSSPRYLNLPLGVTAVNPSVRVLPSTSTAQTELYLASNKANRNVMWGSSNNVTGSTINSGCFVTTNNGVNWGGWQIINAPSTADQRGDPGPVVDRNMRFLFSHLTSSSNFGSVTGIGCNYSTNYGANFSSTFMVENNSQSDKNLSNTDDSPISPYYGYSYTVWCTFSPIASRFARTTNGGVTWDATLTLSTGLASHYVQGHDVACGPNGQVYVTWVSNFSSSPYAADYLGFGRSTNGGANFTSVDNAVDVNGARNNGTFGGWGLRVNDFPRIDVDKSGGPRNGWIYIVLMEINHSPAGSDEDVVLYRSSNQGVNWMPGVRVNQDALNNGKRQFFPAVRVDDYGGVNIIYYDNRNFPNADSATVMISRSMDGGTTFSDFEITDHHFKPKAATGMSGGYMGDYIGLAIGNNKVFGFWMDDKAGASGFYNAWAASFDLGPSINHTPLTTTEQTTGTRAVNCTITPAGSGINPSLTRLYYAKNSTSWTLVQLTNSGGTNWTGNITLSGPGTYNYYLTTTDSMNRVATAPAGAPTNYYSFIASSDTVKPVITHTPLPNWPRANWPANVSATVTDNIGVDSVWVKWYKNNTGTGIKHFKLNFTSGNNYAANFNSTQADVAVNDSIFYRVFARDNSSGHNMDSTALYKFKITSIVTITIGTGTSTEAYPFERYYNYARWQAIYTRSEIGTTGAITKIRFYQANSMSGVTTGPTQIYFKLVPDSTMATGNWDVTGHTMVYTGTINNLAAAGWLEIVLSSPFNFQMSANQNLLISISRDYQAYITSYPLYNYTTLTTYKSRRNRSDTAIPTSLTQSYNRANIQIEMNTVMGAGNQPISEIPNKFDLKQNYPNPFNPVTKISFDIPKQGFVTLKVFDVLGREVKVLVNEVKAPGAYSVDFNALELSSGVYFYKIETNGFSDIKKMMLIK